VYHQVLSGMVFTKSYNLILAIRTFHQKLFFLLHIYHPYPIYYTNSIYCRYPILFKFFVINAIYWVVQARTDTTHLLLQVWFCAWKIPMLPSALARSIFLRSKNYLTSRSRDTKKTNTFKYAVKFPNLTHYYYFK